MSRLGLLFLRIALLLAALALWIMIAAQQTVTIMGATTIGDAYRRVTEQFPDWTETLFSAPWWVPAVLATVATLLLVWPARAPRQTGSQPVYTTDPNPRIERGQAGDHVPFGKMLFGQTPSAPLREPYLKDQHIYAGSARLTTVPEFRAIPVRHISRASIFIEYSAYSTESHLWEPRKRVLVAEVHDQEVGEWSVINVELMTSFQNETGGLTWRWAREFDFGQPEDPDYDFMIEDHYQGRVVFEAPDGTVQYSYFAIMPSRDDPSDMPNLISLGIFDFVREWESEDQILTI